MGYKKSPEFDACIQSQQKQMYRSGELLALARKAKTAEERKRLRSDALSCSYDFGLFEINDYWGSLSPDANGENAAPCKELAGKDLFYLDNNVSCMVKMARCGVMKTNKSTSIDLDKNGKIDSNEYVKDDLCDFSPWHGYDAGGCREYQEKIFVYL